MRKRRWRGKRRRRRSRRRRRRREGQPRQREKAILCAAVASLFSVLTDARAQPLDEWPCAE